MRREFRTWGEAYGISATNSAQANYVGDRRQTWGGVAGIGARVAPGVNVGFSVDQSHTAIDVPLAMQSATLDLTQFGFNASVDEGAVDLGHRAGARLRKNQYQPRHRRSARQRRLQRLSHRRAHRTQLLLEHRPKPHRAEGRGRICPRDTGSFQEMGGLNPLTATGATVERGRILLGRGIGHYWIFDRKVLDLSAYGKFVDNVTQNFSSIIVSLGSQSITVQGIGESQYGADAGASASLSLSNTSASTPTMTPNSARRSNRIREPLASR